MATAAQGYDDGVPCPLSLPSGSIARSSRGLTFNPKKCATTAVYSHIRRLKVRAKIEGIERLLPGIDSLAVVSTRPHLLGFDIRRNVSLKVSRLRVLFGPQTDLAVAVTRCPSLLTMSSHTAAGKLEKLQEALPSGLDARYRGKGGRSEKSISPTSPTQCHYQQKVCHLPPRQY